MKINDDVIYPTGMTLDGELLFGGVWKSYHQDGIPMDVTHDYLRENGHRVDWVEAMVDASMDNNLPSIMKQIEFILSEDEIRMLKQGYTYLFLKDDPSQELKFQRMNDFLETKRNCKINNLNNMDSLLQYVSKYQIS